MKYLLIFLFGMFLGTELMIAAANASTLVKITREDGKSFQGKFDTLPEAQLWISDNRKPIKLHRDSWGKMERRLQQNEDGSPPEGPGFISEDIVDVEYEDENGDIQIKQVKFFTYKENYIVELIDKSFEDEEIRKAKKDRSDSIKAMKALGGQLQADQDLKPYLKLLLIRLMQELKE